MPFSPEKTRNRKLEARRDFQAIAKLDDHIKVTDEEFIEAKYSFAIIRGIVLHQTNHYTLYNARYLIKTLSPRPAICMLVVKSVWTFRHREEFLKNATRIMRYVSQTSKQFKNLNGKTTMLSLPFLRVLEVFMADTKIYIFYESHDNLKPLDVVLGIQKKDLAKRVETDSGPPGKPFNREEISNLLWQLLNGILFLNRMSIAHANINLETIMISTENFVSDLTNAKLYLAGLTRPLIFYNPDTERAINSAGVDPETEYTMIEFYPPEALTLPEFNASQTDIYAWAIVAAYLVGLRSPFKGLKDHPAGCKKLVNFKQQNCLITEISPRFSGPLLEQAIASCTNPNPKTRSTAEEMLSHTFFTSFWAGP